MSYKKSKFTIGDSVVMVNTGKIFSTWDRVACFYRLDKWISGITPDIGLEYEVTQVFQDPTGTGGEVCIVSNGEQEFIIGVNGLAFNSGGRPFTRDARRLLDGRFFLDTNCDKEFMIQAFSLDESRENWILLGDTWVTPEFVFENYLFVDGPNKGKPVGVYKKNIKEFLNEL